MAGILDLMCDIYLHRTNTPLKSRVVDSPSLERVAVTDKLGVRFVSCVLSALEPSHLLVSGSAQPNELSNDERKKTRTMRTEHTIAPTSERRESI